MAPNNRVEVIPPTEREFDGLRGELLAKKSRVLNDIMERLRTEAREEYQGLVQTIQDEGDIATAELKKTTALTLVKMKVDELDAINDALARMARDEFGRCEDCGKWIQMKRLKAVPQASRCLECQARWEQVQKV